MGFEDGFGDGQSHAGALDDVTLVSAAVELVKDQVQFHFFDSGAAIGDAGDDATSLSFGGDGDGLFGRGIGIGVFNQANQHILDAVEIGADGRQSGGNLKAYGPGSEDGFALLERGGGDFGDVLGCEFKLELAGIQASHLGGVADQLVEAVAFLVDDGQQLVGLGSGFGGREQAGDGCLDGSERSAEVMGDGIEQGGFEALAFARGFGFSEFLDGACAFDGDGHQGAQGFEGAEGEEAAGNANTADGAGAGADGSEGKTQAGVGKRLVADGGALHIFFGKVRGSSGVIKLAFVLEVERGGSGAEGFNDVVGDGVQQGDGVAGNEQALAEGVEAFGFVALALGAQGFAPGACGELTDDERGGEEGQEGDPILRVGDGEGADRLDKEVVEHEHGGQGHKGGNQQSPERGNG